MIASLRAAAIASVMAVVASTSVIAQTTGTIPPQPPPYGVAPSHPPSTANQFSSNEIIDAGHHFFGSVSRGLAEIVEKTVSKWGLPNGYILGEEASVVGRIYQIRCDERVTLPPTARIPQP